METKTTEERFWEKVDKNGPKQPHMKTQCWVWIASFKPKGYGQFRYDKTTGYAHRYSWELHDSPIPSGMSVCHHCDNRACVRPDHLFLGTSKDNSQDMVKKGRCKSRGKPGEEHANAILTDDQIQAMRDRWDKHELHKSDGHSIIDIARDFNVSVPTVHRIVYRKAWKHVK